MKDYSVDLIVLDMNIYAELMIRDLYRNLKTFN